MPTKTPLEPPHSFKVELTIYVARMQCSKQTIKNMPVMFYILSYLKDSKAEKGLCRRTKRNKK